MVFGSPTYVKNSHHVSIHHQCVSNYIFYIHHLSVGIKVSWLDFCSVFLLRVPAVTKVSATWPLAACGLSRPSCSATPPSDCSSATTPSVPNSTDGSRRSLTERQPDPENQPLFLLPLCFDVKKCASGWRHPKLFRYTGSFNMKYWSEPDTTRFQTELYCFLCCYDGPASPLHSIDILLINHSKLYLCK